jgi:hypothetical protein
MVINLIYAVYPVSGAIIRAFRVLVPMETRISPMERRVSHGEVANARARQVKDAGKRH